MFIYRKSADRNYRLEDIPPDERYLAELHIAKHRNGPTGLVRMFFSEATTSFKNLDNQTRETAMMQQQPQNAPVKLRPKSDFMNKPNAAPDVPQM